MNEQLKSEHSDNERCPTCGLPQDLEAVLRDQSIIVPQDAGVFELIAKWANALSNTASADAPEDVSVSREHFEAYRAGRITAAEYARRVRQEIQDRGGTSS